MRVILFLDALAEVLLILLFIGASGIFGFTDFMFLCAQLLWVAAFLKLITSILKMLKALQE